MTVNKYLVAELQGLVPNVDYTGATTAGAAIDRLFDLIAQEHTTRQRGHLDEMSVAAHRQLLVELNGLKAAVGTFNAP